MKKVLLFAMASCLFISCDNKTVKVEPSANVPVAQGGTAVDSATIVNDPKSNLNIQTNNYTQIDSSGWLMFPLSMGESQNASSEKSYKDMPEDKYWNIVFYNSKTGEYKLLTERKMLVRNVLPDNEYQENAAVKMSNLFYMATTDDYNNDGRLTTADPEYLFISDKEGNNFLQVSPPGQDVIDWQYLPATGKIIMNLRKDSDKNLLFNGTDERATYAFSIATSTAPEEIFPTEFKNKLKVQFDKQWRRNIPSNE